MLQHMPCRALAAALPAALAGRAARPRTNLLCWAPDEPGTLLVLLAQLCAALWAGGDFLAKGEAVQHDVRRQEGCGAVAVVASGVGELSRQQGRLRLL